MNHTRRGFLHSTGLAGLAAGAVPAGGPAGQPGPAGGVSPAGHGPAPGPAVVPFYGSHQAGIATPAQDYLQFAALDMASTSVADLRAMLRSWTHAAALMSLGKPVGRMDTGSKPPADTGEAVGLGPSRLTVTFGFGPSLFESNGQDRFGLAAKRPDPLVDLPPFPGDALDASISGGDLGIQVCADDPQVAFHAVHELIRIARPVASPRWLIAGSGRTGNSRSQPMPRNVMGFLDGTANIKSEEAGALSAFVWAGEPTSPAWMRGGSYLVARRIQISLATWDETGLDGQRHSIGRDKVAGTVLPGISVSAHILRASPGFNAGQRILRRGYGYFDGVDKATGAPAAGSMFLCYQRDPRAQFIAIQQQLAAGDALNKFVTHIGSAVFACPPGAGQGEFVGQALFA